MAEILPIRRKLLFNHYLNLCSNDNKVKLFFIKKNIILIFIE